MRILVLLLFCVQVHADDSSDLALALAIQAQLKANQDAVLVNGLNQLSAFENRPSRDAKPTETTCETNTVTTLGGRTFLRTECK